MEPISLLIGCLLVGPHLIHCRQAENTAASHCGQGMVFAVNPGPDGS